MKTEDRKKGQNMKLKCEDCILKCEDPNVNFGWLDSHEKNESSLSQNL